MPVFSVPRISLTPSTFLAAIPRITKICALDSPHNLIMSKGAATVTYTWVENVEHSASCPLGDLSNDEQLKILIEENRLRSIHSSEPTLNDIFMEVTGRTLL